MTEVGVERSVHWRAVSV